MGVVFETEPRRFEFPRPFDVHPVVAIHQDVGDGGIFEQWLERAQTKDFIEDLARQPFPLGKAQRDCFAVDGAANQQQHFLAGGFAGGAAELFEIQAV